MKNIYYYPALSVIYLLLYIFFHWSYSFLIEDFTMEGPKWTPLLLGCLLTFVITTPLIFILKKIEKKFKAS